MKSKISKCKSCGQPFLKYAKDDCFCSLTCNRESFLNNLNQFESQLNKEIKKVVLSVILTVFAFMAGLYIYSGLN